MLCLCPRESHPAETRTTLVPETASRLVQLGFELVAEAGIGERASFADEAYRAAGVKVVPTAELPWSAAKIVLRVRRPEPAEIAQLPQGCVHISFLDPFRERPVIDAMAAQGVNAVSLEMIPRTTLAQKMDALSSQANLAGYAAVIAAAARLPQLMPMLMTPAGTLQPARVFIVGVGVAGLQAIATARRLGARVEAFDTRPVVEEQVKSLGARFVKIDLGETGQTAQGYAKELTPEQIQKQQDGMAKVCASADVVITTAKVFGRPAPRLITQTMIDGMKAGSVIVDLAVETGGNVEGVKPDQEVITPNGVCILGHMNLEARLARHASQALATNFAGFLEHFWDATHKSLRLDREDEIMRGALLSLDGQIIHERLLPAKG